MERAPNRRQQRTERTQENDETPNERRTERTDLQRCATVTGAPLLACWRCARSPKREHSACGTISPKMSTAVTDTMMACAQPKKNRKKKEDASQSL